MNSTIVKALYFVAGAAVGACGMFIGVKKYYELKADLEVASVKEAFEDRLSEIEDTKSSVDGELEGPEEINEPEPGVKPTVSSLTQRLNNKPPLKDYSKMFKEKGEESLKVKEIMRDENELAEAESPSDDEPLSDEEDRDEQLDFEDYQLNGEHKKAKAEGRAPYLIDKADYELTCANYEKATLLYYISDDILCDDSGEEISRGDVIGSLIRESGFDNNDEDTLYVRNDILMCDYEVTKVYISYEG